MAQVRGDNVYAVVSAAVSAGDGVTYDFTAPAPAPLTQPLVLDGKGGGGVSNPQMDMLEFMRRCMTHITTPSTTILQGGSGCSIAVAFGTAVPSGIAGMFHGVPFFISAGGTLSASPTSAMSTASYEIRKVLVCIGMSAHPVASSLAMGGGTVQFTYGPAVRTASLACVSGTLALSYFDYVPLPRPSANEIPVGWINVVNSYLTSGTIPASYMYSDYRVLQGMNFSAMLA